MFVNRSGYLSNLKFLALDESDGSCGVSYIENLQGESHVFALGSWEGLEREKIRHDLHRSSQDHCILGMRHGCHSGMSSCSCASVKLGTLDRSSRSISYLADYNVKF